MKKKATLYTVFSRQNMWKPLLQQFIVALSSYPALLVEIFTRHKFGQRYYSLSSCITALVLLLLFGVVFTDWQDLVGMLLGVQGRFISRNGSEYLMMAFIVAALIQGVRHKREQQRHGRTVDFERYSRSNGQAYDYLYRLEQFLPQWLTNRVPVNAENIWRYYEPLTAVLIGLLLLPMPFTRLLGLMLLMCGLFYYWRTSIQYAGGYEYVLDLIDEMIIAEDARNFMSPDSGMDQERGVNVYAPMPDDPNLREKLLQRMQYDLDHPYEEESPALIP